MDAQTPVFQVSQLNLMAKQLLEEAFPAVLIEGEISNFAAPFSGHWYFSLKDDKAQVRCAMFRHQNSRLNFQPEDGMQVLLKAHVSLYEGRGEFQLIVNDIQPQGDGLLQKQFELLKTKCQQAGWFDEQHKKPIPSLCHRIAVITSATGAAIRDVLSTLERRYPLADVLLYPSQVQGKTAANTLVQAIEQANADNMADVILLVRGGGSLEDLWSFNEEIVAKAIFESQLPIVTGIGHEVDFTIADFVADHRSATPTAAAETVSPNQTILLQQLANTLSFLQQHIQTVLKNRLDTLALSQKRLHRCHPKQQLQQQAQHCDQLQQRLIQCIKTKLRLKQQQFKHLIAQLNTLNPLQTLQRGYTISFVEQKAITSVQHLKPGQRLTTKLQDGEVISTVEKVTT